jgi:hypothetical protein
VAFAIPRDAQGITAIETRRPSDTRDEEEGWDAPKAGGISQAFLLFDDVFVPNERIFLQGETEYAAIFIGIFTALYRAPSRLRRQQGDVDQRNHQLAKTPACRRFSGNAYEDGDRQRDDLRRLGAIYQGRRILRMDSRSLLSRVSKVWWDSS